MMFPKAALFVSLLASSGALKINVRQSTTKASGAAKIPNHLLFIVADNWESWIDGEDETRLIGPGNPSYEKTDEYSQRLMLNINNTIEKHSSGSSKPKVYLYDTKMCEEAVKEAGGPALFELFQNLRTIYKGYHQPTGHAKASLFQSQDQQDRNGAPWAEIYRSDICRIAALWKVGGWYFDTDMSSNMDVRDLVKSDAEFVSVKSDIASSGFFTSLIGATSKNDVLLISAKNLAAEFAKNPYLLGTHSLKTAFETWETEVGKETAASKSQFFIETRQKQDDDRYEHHEDRKEQMVREHSKPDRKIGANGCEILVFDPETKKIPFWSRIFRSGNCD